MSNERIVKLLDRIGALGFRVTALVNVEGIEIVAVDPEGQTYRVKADPDQRYEACCEIARQLGVDVNIEA